MDLFLYMDRDTAVHRLDPRTKILLLLVSFALALAFSTLPPLGVLLALVLLHGAWGAVLSNLRRIRLVLAMIALFSLVIWSIVGPGKSAGLAFSWEGVLYGLMVAAKTDLMIIAGMVFLSTTKIEEISQGLVKLGLPYRGAFAFSTAIRLVPLIVATSATIAQAQKSRGLDLDAGSFLEKIRKHVPLVIPTLISVIRSTNVFSMALESRGFGYSPQRTNFLELRMKGGDYLTVAFALALAAVGLVAKFFPQALESWGAILP
ncbi:MAG TPA: energy-coupling factor transporter transmembrane component T [Synergistaceae bacterium]|nr:energy-coupling factor transporter transmembrane component T [Synergistaceae bacterium]HQF90818.1 energy-coupling factor transporter transmembrane component T [Synergistaceae bacterium]HQH77977.1 energy-coupling factor transporter transmembrane component T [Synergistaceae bacterium]HQK24895.1 energy-coupling factor transporter transmembrane component T [Synergistaceae bacterium]